MLYRQTGFWGMVLGMALLWGGCKKPSFDSPVTVGGVSTLGNYLQNNFSFTLFSAAVKKAGLMDSLNNPDAAFTLFAPSDLALNKDGILSPTDFNSWPADRLRFYVNSHILRGKIFYSDIPTSSDNLYANLNGVNLFVSKTTNNQAGNFFFIVNGVPVPPAPTLSSSTIPNYGNTQLNGVIYPINSSIKSDTASVQQFLAGRKDMTHLVAGLKQFGFWDKLSGNGPFTLIAPQDSAFERYGITLDSISRMDANHYDPILFGCYFITPNHVYILDMNQLARPGVLVPYFPTYSPNYLLILSASGLLPMAAALSPVPLDPGLNNLIGIGSQKPYGNRGAPYLGETIANQGFFYNAANPPAGTYVNYTQSNGVIHLLATPLVLPGDVSR